MTRESAVAAEKKAVLTARRRPRARSPSRGSSLLSPAVANIASQEKRIQRSARERLENRRYTSTIKTYFHRLEDAVAAGDTERADTEYRELASTVDRAVKRGALHRNTGARKKARAAKIRAGAGSA
jgi:small subunit ribosomal protein S20